MILFDLLMTIIEDYCLAYFNCKINHVKFNIFSMIVVPLLCICLTFFFNYYLLDNFLLLLSLLLVNFLASSYMNKKISIYYFLIPTILIVLLGFSNTVALIVTAIVYNIQPQDILTVQESVVVLCLLSRIIYISLSYMFYKMEKRLNVNTKKVLQNNFWISFCVFSITFIGLHTILYEAIFYDFIGHVTIYEMLIMFMILGVSFFIFFIRIQKEYMYFIEVNDELVKIKYKEENNKKIKKLSYEVYFEKHRMYYTLLNVRNLIMNNQINLSIEFLDKKIDQLNNLYLCQSNNQGMFNLYIIDYINEMKEKGYDIKFVMTAENNKLLDYEEVVKSIRAYLEYFFAKIEENKIVNIQVYEQNQYLILKVNTPNQLNLEDIDKSNHTEYLKKINSKNLDGMTEIDLLFEI